MNIDIQKIAPNFSDKIKVLKVESSSTNSIEYIILSDNTAFKSVEFKKENSEIIMQLKNKYSSSEYIINLGKSLNKEKKLDSDERDMINEIFKEGILNLLQSAINKIIDFNLVVKKIKNKYIIKNKKKVKEKEINDILYEI